LGYLYLRKGIWNGQPVISKEWIEVSTQQHIETAGKMNDAEDEGYGYLWWMNDFGGFSAHGFGGQYLFVIPELDMIVVFTSGLEDPSFPLPKELVETYILPAIQSSEPLASNPQAFHILEATIKHLEHPAAEPAAPLPEIARQISGKTFQITQDGSGGQMFTTISLSFNSNSEYTSTTDWPIGGIHVMQGGLDNVFRTDDGIALKGTWQDDHTFVEYHKPMAYQIDTSIQTYTFDGKTLTIDVHSSMGFYSFRSIGELIE
jgi:hypothetical protein